MDIAEATLNDIDKIADIYQACFPNERSHRLWVSASFQSFPRGVYYVIQQNSQILGYILWCIKNGFRDKTIIELEQIGIHPNHAGKGLGRSLIDGSLPLFTQHLEKLGHELGAIIVTTSEGNFAQKLYESSLGVKPAATLAGYGSGNEVILYNNELI